MHAQLVLALLLLTVIAAATVSGRSFHRVNYYGIPRRIPPRRISSPRLILGLIFSRDFIDTSFCHIKCIPSPNDITCFDSEHCECGMMRNNLSFCPRTVRNTLIELFYSRPILIFLVQHPNLSLVSVKSFCY